MKAQQRVLIVGAGIGGLTLAQSFRKHGLHVDVAEQAPVFRPVGAGISLSINAIQVFDELDIGTDVRNAGHYITNAAMCKSTGGYLRQFLLPRLSRVNEGGLWIFVRAELHAALANHLDDVRFRMGVKLTSLMQDERAVYVEFNDGSNAEYDLVVGADGAGSQVRGSIFGVKTTSQYKGVKCWQFVIEDFTPSENEFREHLGRGRRVGVAPLMNNRVYGFLTRSARQGAIDDWANDSTRVRADFTEFGGDAARMLDRLDEVTPLIARDFVEVRLPRWHDRRVVLIGDAAHTMTPNLGQGAAMAIEDAWVLGRLLASDAWDEHTFAKFEAARRERVSFVQNRSALVGRLMQARHPITTTLRDASVAWSPELPHALQFQELYANGPVAPPRERATTRTLSCRSGTVQTVR